MRVKHIVLTLVFAAISIVVNSQPNNPATNPDAVPITGLEYLLIGGGVYGVSRFIKKRKNKNNQS